MQPDPELVKSSLQKPKWLQKALAVSLVANIALACFSLVEWHETGYLMMEKFHYSPQKTYVVSFEPSGSLLESISQIKSKSYEELIASLNDDTLLFEGYRTRDLALACLNEYHQFNTSKALSQSLAIKERRKVHVGDVDLTIFPGLQPEQFLAVNRFVQEERYPFTSEGLFLRLADQQEDESLKAACRSTPEYIALETLFKNDATQEELLAFSAGIGYKGLSEYFEGQKKALDTTILKKREFLVTFVQAGNKHAAQFLMKIDRDYALHKLDDKEALMLLALLDNPVDYAAGLLKSNRKAEVLKSALACLQKKNPQLLAKVSAPKEAGKSVQVASKASPRKHTNKMTTVKTASISSARTYVVQAGDSLWRIAKKFHVAIGDIKRINRLQSDDLKPGTTLSIPN